MIFILSEKLKPGGLTHREGKSFTPSSHMNNYTSKLQMLPLLHKANITTSKFNCLCISTWFSVKPVMLTCQACNLNNRDFQVSWVVP